VEKFYLDSKSFVSSRRTVSTSCNGYLAEFRNLNITTVNLNELLFKSPDIKPKVNDYVIRIEVRLQGTLDVCFVFEDFNTAKTRRTISSKSKRLLPIQRYIKEE
jgi:hypothetical protein